MSYCLAEPYVVPSHIYINTKTTFVTSRWVPDYCGDKLKPCMVPDSRRRKRTINNF